MLVSKPIKETDTFAVSSVGYIVNTTQINFEDLPLIYFADIITDEEHKLKQTKNYELRNIFFEDKDFKFNEAFNSLENLKKQIELLETVNEDFIKKIVEVNKIPENKMIQFYIDYVYYIVDKIVIYPNNLELKYRLLLKNCEFLSHLNKFNSNVINNLNQLYSELTNI